MKDNRSALNPFTGKKHYDNVDDDVFLNECYESYYDEISQYQIIDQTDDGKLVFDVTKTLINTVENYLHEINRYDYVDGYYDWEVHLVNSNIENACCYPGGKIIIYSGILSKMQYIDDLAFILSHEISHALLDHSRTAESINNTKNSLSTITQIGSLALDLMGFETMGNLTRTTAELADIGSHYFLTKPWGRDQELEADKLGLIICYLAGYNVRNIPNFWKNLTNEDHNDFDFFSTHPSDDKRIAIMNESLIEIFDNDDFYSKPLLPETPTVKNISKQDIQTQPIEHIHEFNVTNPQEDTNKICPNCYHTIIENARYCIECGYKLQNNCIYCNYPVEENQSYCINCGKKID